ncbi:hypothetical protein NDU88_000205 [Pleurodeles waltl]|uniref:Uncharacterized protein n=1 Tax=Pleurodeles waltl TaxID=8319 RepID=A0AAV7S7I0_PLEWA|nr:hypothetical protein NDU88_000205 [Pleurodeles waltl]
MPRKLNAKKESQLPGVSARRGPGPLHSGTHLKRTTCPATISSVPTGAYQGSLSATLSASSVFARAQSSSSSQAARSMSPDRTATSASRCSVSLVASRRPDPLWGHACAQE